MSLIELIYDYITSTVFNYDPAGDLAAHGALIDAWALFTTLFMALVIFVLIIKMVIRMTAKVGSMFMGGRFY